MRRPLAPCLSLLSRQKPFNDGGGILLSEAVVVVGGGGVPQISNLNRRLRRSLRSGGWRSQLNPWFCARRSVWGLYGPCAVCSQLLPRISAPPTKNKKKLRAARNRPDLQHDRFSINSLNPHRLNPHQAAADNPGCSIVLPVLEPRFWGWTDRDCDKPE